MGSKKKGFAALPPEERAALGARGGRAAHEAERAHKWTSEEARAATRARWAREKKKRRQKKKGAR